MDLIPNFVPLLGTADSEMYLLPLLCQGGTRIFINEHPPWPTYCNLVTFYDMQGKVCLLMDDPDESVRYYLGCTLEVPEVLGVWGQGRRESLVVTSAVGIVDFEREVLCEKCIRL